VLVLPAPEPTLAVKRVDALVGLDAKIDKTLPPEYDQRYVNELEPPDAVTV
jgi:hypothetical protein